MHFPSNSQFFNEIITHQDFDGENNKKMKLNARAVIISKPKALNSQYAFWQISLHSSQDSSSSSLNFY